MSARLWRFKRFAAIDQARAATPASFRETSSDAMASDPLRSLPAPYLACFEVRGSDSLNVRLLAAAPANEVGEPLGVKRVVGQKVELLASHLAAKLAKYAPHIEFEIDPRVTARQIADATHRAIVPALVQASTTAAQRFF